MQGRNTRAAPVFTFAPLAAIGMAMEPAGPQTYRLTVESDGAEVFAMEISDVQAADLPETFAQLFAPDFPPADPFADIFGEGWDEVEWADEAEDIAEHFDAMGG